MNVLFHIATETEWELAPRLGVYTPDSLASDGFVHCSSAVQHAIVANALFPGRTDLVLLLIDTSRLSAEVRLEGEDREGQPFPHIYGPVNLEAVFEAAPYAPDEDGHFRTHEEAIGFATSGGATLEETQRRAVAVMTGFERPWWVAGGWALDLFLGRRSRPHADLEISILDSAQHALFEYLAGWDLRLPAPEHTLSPWDGGLIEPPYHQVWARKGPGMPSSPVAFGADPTMLDFLIEREREGRWAFRRDLAITLPLDEFGDTTTRGIPFVRPEVALLYKAKSTRFKDHRDFDLALPHLSEGARVWLAAALDHTRPGHPWRSRL